MDDDDFFANTMCCFCGGGEEVPMTYGTNPGGYNRNGSDWSNGVEAWCGLTGEYVTFVRKADASPPLDEIVLCTFGVVSNGIEV